MSGTVERAYASADAIVAFGRQPAAGTPRTAKLWKSLLVDVDPQTPFDMSDRGIEVGSGTNMQQRSQKEVFKPAVNLNGHLQVGSMAMNLLCASGYMIISEGTDPASPVTSTLSAAVNSRFASSATFTDASGFTVGDWVQIGALTTPGSPIITDKSEIHQITAISTNTVTFGNGHLLYTYPSGTAVKKVRSDRKIDHWFLHLQSSNDAAGANDLFTAYVKFSNGTQTYELLFFDGKATGLSTALSVGQIATFQNSLKCLDVTRDGTTLAGVTLVADPNPISLNNTRGNFNLLGDTVNAPQQFNINMTNTIYEDSELTHLQEQSNIILSHAINMTSQGKFIKAFFDQIVFGGSGNTVVSDAIPESTFEYLAQSAKVIGGGTDHYGFEVSAQDVQLAGYSPKINTNQVVTGGIEMAKVVPAEADGSERWLFHLINNCPTDVACAL